MIFHQVKSLSSPSGVTRLFVGALMSSNSHIGSVCAFWNGPVPCPPPEKAFFSFFPSSDCRQARQKAGDYLWLCSALQLAHCRLASIDLVPSVLDFAGQEDVMLLTTLCKSCGLFKRFVLSGRLRKHCSAPPIFFQIHSITQAGVPGPLKGLRAAISGSASEV